MLSKSKNKKGYLLKGFLLSLIGTIIIVIFISLFLKFSNLREMKLPLLTNIAMIVSIAIGSIYSSNKIGEKGWVNGAIIGLGYYLILVLLNIVFIKPFIMDFILLSRLFIAVVVGIIGGMVGINLS